MNTTKPVTVASADAVAVTVATTESHASAGWGRGIRDDVRNTLALHWRSEMTNMNGKTLAVSLFIFFACIAPAITFGAMYAKMTHNWIGAVEMILATAWCGIVYALVGGQPMMINGGTGPVLTFTAVLYQLAVALEVPFLTLNAWVGLWVAVYMLVAAFADLNRFIVLATRFTDDIFAGLISVIFIVNALGSPTSPVGVLHYFDASHASHRGRASDSSDSSCYSHDSSALLSLLLCFGTAMLAIKLKQIKQSAYLTRGLRSIVNDFAVVASIMVWTLVDHFAVPAVQTERLAASDSFEPTFACCDASCVASWPEDCEGLAEPWGRRAWLVRLDDLNGKGWLPVVAAAPAFLAFILVFLDNGITWHLINRPENKLTHGHAYNWDTIVIGVMVAINSMFGLPWLVAATVRSINHVQAMAEKDAAGRIASVQQTRLTHLFIHVLVLVAIFTMGAVRQIPVPVLYGVFLFMGIASLSGNQLITRLQMLFMEAGLRPKAPFTHRDPSEMRPGKMLQYTALQLGVFVLLYLVKSIKAIAIAFPLVIAACIPIRVWLLPRAFTRLELVLLDGDDEEIEGAMK